MKFRTYSLFSLLAFHWICLTFLKNYRSSAFITLLLFPLWGFAQSNIPVGSWRAQVSYLDPAFLIGNDKTIFALGAESLFYFSTEEEETFPLSKLDGLYSQEFSTAGFDPIQKKLLIAYTDGTLDLIGESNIRTISTLRNNSQIQNKKIYRIKTLTSNTFLAAAFGVGVIHTQTNQFIDAFINIGPQGSNLAVFDITEDNENFYIATQQGVFFGNKSSNLKDFRNWNNLDPSSVRSYTQVEYEGTSLFGLAENGSIYLFKNGVSEQLIGPTGVSKIKKFSNRLFFQKERSIYQIFDSGSFQEYFSSEIEFFDFHIAGDRVYLNINGSGIFDTDQSKAFAPNGAQTKIQAFSFNRNGALAFPYFRSATGVFNISPSVKSSKLKDGVWNQIIEPAQIIASQTLNQKTYFATRNQGLWVQEDDVLSSVDFPGGASQPVLRTIQKDQFGQLWIGIEDDQNRLFKIDASGSIQTIMVTGMTFPSKIEIDNRGNLWILQSNNLGNTSLRVFNEDSGLNRLIDTSPNQGLLSNARIQDLAIDRADRLWLGLSNGVLFLPNISATQNNSPVNAVQPIFQNLPLLAGEFITAITIGADQSLWIGTRSNGLFQFSTDPVAQLLHFTQRNSPLFSNQINHLTYNDLSGELLITTPSGGLSYRVGVLAPQDQLGTLKIFPNPVRPDFNGYLTIEGLTAFSQVKISTAAGRVIYSSQVQGGSLTWNLLDNSGNRPVAGVYLVFVLDENGNERVASKFVIL